LGVRRLGLAAALGLALGAFCLAGDVVPLRAVNGLANAATPWFVIAFVAGAAAGKPRWGAVAGVLALVSALTTYYLGFASLWWGRVPNLEAQVGAWLVAALAAGPILGAAGGAWADRRHPWRVASAALLGGLFLADGVYRLVAIQAWAGIDVSGTLAQVAVIDLGAGALAVLGLAPTRQRLQACLLGIAVGLMGLVALAAVSWLARGSPFAA
jgi:Family of unknown function (DUF6518)